MYKIYTLALGLLLVGCSISGSVNGTSSESGTRVLETEEVKLTRSVYRYYDKEYGVVCYKYYGDGISCVKVK